MLKSGEHWLAPDSQEGTAHFRLWRAVLRQHSPDRSVYLLVVIQRGRDLGCQTPQGERGIARALPWT